MVSSPAVAAEPCRLCGKSDFQVAAEQKDGQRRIVLCMGCGLLHACDGTPALTVDASSLLTKHRIIRSFPLALLRLTRVSPWLEPGASVLDIGSRAGEFLYAVRGRGIEVEGIEPDPQYAAYSRDVLHLPVRCQPLESIQLGSRRYQFMTAFQVLQRMNDPVVFLLSIRRWLAPGGLLAIEVPNIESPRRHPGHRFPDRERVFFNGPTLRRTAELAGLSLVASNVDVQDRWLFHLYRASATSQADSGLLPGNAQGVWRALEDHSVIRYYLREVPIAINMARVWNRLVDRWQATRYPNAEAIFHSWLVRERTLRTA